MAFRAGNHPESWSLSPEAEHAFLCNDLAAARKDLMRSARKLSAREHPAVHYVRRAVAELDNAVELMERER